MRCRSSLYARKWSTSSCRLSAATSSTASTSKSNSPHPKRLRRLLLKGVQPAARQSRFRGYPERTARPQRRAFSFAHRSIAAMRTAIVSAMHEELSAVLALMPDEHKVALGGREFFDGHLHGHEVVTVLSRIG